MDIPKLLVMITTYSRGYNLPTVVDSVVSQVLIKNYKIIIADDCSPDDPTEIIKGIKQKYPNVDIEHHRNHTNVGEGLNINIILGREWDNQFKYLVILQDDTIYLDYTFLYRGIMLLESNPDTAYVGGIPDYFKKAENASRYPKNVAVFKMNGIDFWRRWLSLGFHWAACIFRYDAFLKYRLFDLPRKDVLQGDSLLLIRLALKSNVIIYRNWILDLGYNKNGGGYYAGFKDPVDKFVSEEKYFRLASESAVESGVSKEEAEKWLRDIQVRLAIQALNGLGGNQELIQKFLDALLMYDAKVPVEILRLAIPAKK